MRPTPARPSLPDGFGLPFIAPFAIWATLLCGGPRLRLPYDNGPLPGRDWDCGVRRNEDGLRSHMEFMRRAYKGEFK